MRLNLRICFSFIFVLWAVKGVSAADLPGVPGKSARLQNPKSAANLPEGALPEVLIKGGEKSGVRSEKPLLEMRLNMEEAVLPAMEVETDLLQRSPESLRNPSAGFATSIYNSNTILPARIRLARDPVKVFYPLRQILAISPSQFQEIGTGWEMTITDSDGHAFQKFTGRGLPPASVPWNGRSERTNIVSPGQNYSTVITYRDTRGQSRTFVGDPFSFDGVIHQESKGLVISLSLSSVFQDKREMAGTETIGDSGLELLQEAGDYIKRYYFTYPVTVECYARDADLSETRAQAVAKILRSLMLLPRESIPYKGFSSGIKAEQIEIIISNR